MIDEYLESAWGRTTETPAEAAGLCKRASLVLLEMLQRRGVTGALLFNLSEGTPESPYGQQGMHFIVVVGAEYIDPTARQFRASGKAVDRGDFGDLRLLWRRCDQVDPDARDPFWPAGHLDRIPENWRELANSDPPGDAIGWEYPGGWPIPPSG